MNRFFLILFYVVPVLGYGKAKTLHPKCNISKDSDGCPSNFICVSQDEGWKCICDRFYGFYGPQCKNLSASSYLLLIGCLIMFFVSLLSVIYNVQLMLLLYKTKKLKFYTFSVVGLNTLSSGLWTGLTSGLILTVFQWDKQMIFHQKIRIIILISSAMCTILSSLVINGYWISITKQISSKSEHLKYQFQVYGSFASIIIAFFLMFLFFDPMISAALVSGVISGWSYHYGGKVVVMALRKLHDAEDTTSRVNLTIVQVMKAVQQTADIMGKYAIAITLSVLLWIFTAPTPFPIYSQQNELPRWCAGQIAAILVSLR